MTEIDPALLTFTLNDPSIDNLNNQSLIALHRDDLQLEVTHDDVIFVNISYFERINRLLSVSMEVNNVYIVVIRKYHTDGRISRKGVRKYIYP